MKEKFFIKVLHEEPVAEFSLQDIVGGADCGCNCTDNGFECGCFGGYCDCNKGYLCYPNGGGIGLCPSYLNPGPIDRWP